MRPRQKRNPQRYEPIPTNSAEGRRFKEVFAEQRRRYWNFVSLPLIAGFSVPAILIASTFFTSNKDLVFGTAGGFPNWVFMLTGFGAIVFSFIYVGHVSKCPRCGEALGAEFFARSKGDTANWFDCPTCKVTLRDV